MKKFKFYLFVTLYVFSLYFLLYHIRTVSICGVSMFPTLYTGDYCIMYRTQNVTRGDIICFNRGTEQYVKRVIGVPGDTFKITDYGIAYLKNNKFHHIEENYLLDTLRENNCNQIVNVPLGHLFVMGDNRPASYDSRQFGLIKINDVNGKILCSICRRFESLTHG